MSKSFMDAIRGVVTEGARDKTADGMTKDAAHFRTDLHKIQDSGMKHLVQKDSETKDYEKMFSGDVDRAPSNRGSYAPGEDLNKYVEYNEHLEILEAKKAAKEKRGCDDDCECKDCESDKKDINEIVAQPGTPAGDAYEKAKKNNAGKPALPLQAGQKMPLMRDGPDSTGKGGVRRTVNPIAKAPAPAIGDQGKVSKPPNPVVNKTKADAITQGREQENKAQVSNAVQRLKSPMVGQGSTGSSADKLVRKKPENLTRNLTLNVKAQGGTGRYGDQSQYNKKPNYGPPGAGSAAKPNYGPPGTGSTANVPPKPKLRPPGGSTADAKKGAAKPPAVKPGAAKPAKPVEARPSARERREARMKLDKGAVGPEAKKLLKTSGLGVTTGKTVVQKPMQKAKRLPGTGMGMKESFDIEINGISYVVSEAHASAIAAFVEKHGMVNEGTAGDFIKKEMEHPEKLTAKGKKQKIKQAIAIYYSKKRRG